MLDAGGARSAQPLEHVVKCLRPEMARESLVICWVCQLGTMEDLAIWHALGVPYGKIFGACVPILFWSDLASSLQHPASSSLHSHCHLIFPFP
jgi:hypothetical protein